VKAVEADLDMLAALLEEGPEASRSTAVQKQRQLEDDEYFRETESEIARQSEARRRQNESVRYSEVKKPSRNSGRASVQDSFISEEPRPSNVKKPSRNSTRSMRDDSGDEADRLSSARMMEEADKPDWQKQREQEERGSFRSNARREQERLDRMHGVSQDAGGYYSDSPSDDEPQIKMTYSSKQQQQNTKRK
jgi:hypothetical protein